MQLQLEPQPTPIHWPGAIRDGQHTAVRIKRSARQIEADRKHNHIVHRPSVYVPGDVSLIDAGFDQFYESYFTISRELYLQFGTVD